MRFETQKKFFSGRPKMQALIRGIRMEYSALSLLMSLQLSIQYYYYVGLYYYCPTLTLLLLSVCV